MSDFMQAGEWLKEGKSVRRKYYLNPKFRIFMEGALFFNLSGDYVEKISNIFESEDFFAKDWEIFEEDNKSLSDKIETNPWLGSCCKFNDVKKFINKLKMEFCDCNEIDGVCKYCNVIERESGEKFK